MSRVFSVGEKEDSRRIRVWLIGFRLVLPVEVNEFAVALLEIE